MITAAIICLAIVVIAIVVVLAVLVYNQMLLLNEVNKRLLVMAKDAVEHDRHTTEELHEAVRQLDAAANEETISQDNKPVEEDAPFNPHTYDPDLDLR